MSYNFNQGDTVKLDNTKLKVLSVKMSSHFAKRGETFGWVKCEVIEDIEDKYGIGYISEFNGDFLRKV